MKGYWIDYATQDELDRIAEIKATRVDLSDEIKLIAARCYKRADRANKKATGKPEGKQEQ